MTEPAPGRAALIAEGLARFNAGRYWESHEALEAVWRAAPDEERELWQGLIQAAAALLHRERGNRHGVEVTGGRAVAKLARTPPADFPVETVEFGRALERCLGSGGPAPVMKENG